MMLIMKCDFFAVLQITQCYKIKLEGKFELGSQVNQLVKDFTKKMTERGGPLDSLTISAGAPDLNTLVENSKTEEMENVARLSPHDEPLLKEFLNANGEKFHIYGAHHSEGKNENSENGQSNIVVRRKRRRRNGFILII